MSELIYDSMLPRMIAAARSHGSRGIAFVTPIVPQKINADATATVYMFHGDAAGHAGGPLILSVYAGLAAEQACRRAGQRPRVSAW